jgi:hypothetical protein
MKRTKLIFKRVLNLTPLFPTWTKVEKQRSGSQPLCDQFGPFQMNKNNMICKKGLEPDPIFQHDPIWKSRGQVPKPFGNSLAPLKIKRVKLILKVFGT